MNVMVVSNFRFCQTPDGALWTPTVYENRFWHRYLEAFDKVRIVARASPIESATESYQRVDGGAVEFAALPHFYGIVQYLRQVPAAKRVCRDLLKEPAAIILRVPTVLSRLMVPVLKSSGRPFGLEICGDPWAALAPGCVELPLRPVLRWRMTRDMQQACRLAASSAYVTREVLQKHYPSRHMYSGLSDVDLDAVAPGVPERIWKHCRAGRSVESGTGRSNGTRRLLFVGALAQKYKCLDILLEAVQKCLASGMDLQLVVIGGGRHQAEMEAYARACGAAERTTFLGEVLRDRVLAEMDSAELFVLPSRTEGLPRAMIEAMARGLPCIGSAAGGIQELLPAEDTVPAGDSRALASKIIEVLADPARAARMAERNLGVAREYLVETVQPRRREFYADLRRLTENWFSQRRDSVVAESAS
jgi:glycosyltransferase involved in cell wall biosynthesis